MFNPQDPLYENMNNKKVKHTETYLFFDFEGSQFFSQSFLLMIMMFSTTSNPLIYFFSISINFYIDGLSVIIPVLTSRLQNGRFRSKVESLRLLEVITGLV